MSFHYQNSNSNQSQVLPCVPLPGYRLQAVSSMWPELDNRSDLALQCTLSSCSVVASPECVHLLEHVLWSSQCLCVWPSWLVSRVCHRWQPASPASLLQWAYQGSHRLSSSAAWCCASISYSPYISGNRLNTCSCHSCRHPNTSGRQKFLRCMD